MRAQLIRFTDSLVEERWKEAKAAGRKPSTYESYRNTMAKLVVVLKTARNKVNMFVREVVPDPHVDPSHGWAAPL